MLETQELETPKFWLPFVAAGVGFSLLVFCSTVYFLTRPCVFFKCYEIEGAAIFAKRSQQILQQPRSTGNFVAACEDLDKAIALLNSIPRWSKHSPEIKKHLAIYQSRRETLKKLVTALKLQAEAIARAKNAPFTVAEWFEIKLLWQEAIAALKQVPKNSEYYAFAGRRIKQYQEKLAATRKLLFQEKSAVAKLINAKQTVKSAREIQDNASSLADWNLARSHWQTAVKILENIPETTTVFSSIKELKNSWKIELNLAEKRQNIEEVAVNNYRQAIAAAKLAKTAAKNRQLTEAIGHWQTALSKIKAVQQNTFQYRQARWLIPVYSDAINNARQARHLDLRLKQAQLDLEKTCSKTIKICNFTVADNAIKINFTADYIEQVQQTALQAKADKSIKRQVRVMEHISSLEAALKTITNNAGIKLELYNAEETLLLTYVPRK